MDENDNIEKTRERGDRGSKIGGVKRQDHNFLPKTARTTVAEGAGRVML